MYHEQSNFITFTVQRCFDNTSLTDVPLTFSCSFGFTSEASWLVNLLCFSLLIFDSSLAALQCKILLFIFMWHVCEWNIPIKEVEQAYSNIRGVHYSKNRILWSCSSSWSAEVFSAWKKMIGLRQVCAGQGQYHKCDNHTNKTHRVKGPLTVMQNVILF